MKDLIYLDSNSTTRVDPKVIKTIQPFFEDLYANASSNHSFGHKAKEYIQTAREDVAKLINAEPHEIVFTSGATESINLAIKGAAIKYKDKGKHIITVRTEHTAVLDVCKFLENDGFDITYMDVDSDGIIDLDLLKKSLRPDTILVSIMMVNNETGVIQPIQEISKITHHAGAYFMTDGTQAFGKMSIDVDELGIDLMAFSAHKVYGPKGVGGLFVRQRRPNKVKLTPLIHGGGHERNLRSGTSNVPGIVGLGTAAKIAIKDQEKDEKRIAELRNFLESSLLKIPDTSLNGHFEKRLYNVSNVSFKGADADAIMMGLKKIVVSNGSACTSTKIEPSHVLIAMGRSEEEAYSSIRFSLGRFTTQKEIDYVIQEVTRTVEELRDMVL